MKVLKGIAGVKDKLKEELARLGLVKKSGLYLYFWTITNSNEDEFFQANQEIVRQDMKFGKSSNLYQRLIRNTTGLRPGDRYLIFEGRSTKLEKPILKFLRRLFSQGDTRVGDVYREEVFNIPLDQTALLSYFSGILSNDFSDKFCAHWFGERACDAGNIYFKDYLKLITKGSESARYILDEYFYHMSYGFGNSNAFSILCKYYDRFTPSDLELLKVHDETKLQLEFIDTYGIDKCTELGYSEILKYNVKKNSEKRKTYFTSKVEKGRKYNKAAILKLISDAKNDNILESDNYDISNLLSYGILVKDGEWNYVAI